MSFSIQGRISFALWSVVVILSWVNNCVDKFLLFVKISNFEYKYIPKQRSSMLWSSPEFSISDFVPHFWKSDIKIKLMV